MAIKHFFSIGGILLVNISSNGKHLTLGNKDFGGVCQSQLNCCPFSVNMGKSQYLLNGYYMLDVVHMEL